MDYENLKEAGFNSAMFLSLFDRIPEWRQSSIDQVTNRAGIDPEVLRNMVEDFFTNNTEDTENPENPKNLERSEKIRRVGEILKIISEETKYGEDVENVEIPEKIKELIGLVK